MPTGQGDWPPSPVIPETPAEQPARDDASVRLDVVPSIASLYERARLASLNAWKSTGDMAEAMRGGAR
jgi:hypothetical protein